MVLGRVDKTCKRMKLYLILQHIQKLTQNGLNLNLRPGTIKLLNSEKVP